MTDEQKEKAKRAIQDAENSKYMKWLALEKRKSCLLGAGFYGLPYRLLMDLYGGNLQPENEVPLNPFYPQEKPSAACRERIAERLQKVSGDDFTYFLHLVPPRPEQKERDEIYRKIESDEERKEHTPEGMREYYFTPFLRYAKLDAYSGFDWTGNRLPPDEEERIKSGYKKRLTDWQMHPERYSPPILKADNKTYMPTQQV